MANYYVNHGAYATNLGAAPTWGVPQEGDGSSKDAATASGVAALVFTANATAAQTVTVCGVVFTAVASGATGNQFNVGASLTATIDNIVTAINASTTTVASAVATGVPQLRNLVFARNSGGTTLQIMMRVGSAALNTANNANCALNTTMSTSSGLPAAFTGGSGGCWGWLMNPAAIGVSSSYAALAYGVMVASLPLVPVSSAALGVQATPTITDTIWARTGNSPTLTCAIDTTPAIGTPSYPQNLVFDTNTVWTTDGANGRVTVSMSANAATLTLRLMPNTTPLAKIVRCLRRGALRFLFTANATGQINLSPNSSSNNSAPALWEGVTFEEAATVASANAMRLNAGGSVYSTLRFKRCDFLVQAPRSSSSFLSGGPVIGFIAFDGCRMVFNHTAGSDPGPICSASTGSPGGIHFVGCDFSGWPFGRYRVFGGGSYSTGTDLVAVGCTGISLGTTYANLTSASTISPLMGTCVTQSADAGLGFRVESTAGVVDWNPDATPAYPTRSALLLDATTPWSVKMDWFAGVNNAVNQLVTPRMGAINRLASAVRTVSVDFLTPVTVTEFDVVLRVHYISTDGKAYCESTMGNAAALTSPGASWTGIGSYPSHSSRRLTLTTANAVKQGTEVAAYIELVGPPPGGSAIQLYVDPETAIA